MPHDLPDERHLFRLSFVSKLVTSRANYHFNTRMFVNALLQLH